MKQPFNINVYDVINWDVKEGKKEKSLIELLLSVLIQVIIRRWWRGTRRRITRHSIIYGWAEPCMYGLKAGGSRKYTIE